MLETENDLVKVKWDDEGGEVEVEVEVERVARVRAMVGMKSVRDPIFWWRVRVRVRRARAKADADEPRELRRIGLSLETGVTPGLRTGVKGASDV